MRDDLRVWQLYTEGSIMAASVPAPDGPVAGSLLSPAARPP